MRLSRFGLLFVIAASVLVGSSCGYYNRIMSRKDLVDGSEAYKARKFDEAESLFRKAAGRDPQGRRRDRGPHDPRRLRAGRVRRLARRECDLHKQALGIALSRRSWADDRAVRFDGTVRVSAARAAALRACNARARPYIQRDWGVTELQIYRACMAEHNQPE